MLAVPPALLDALHLRAGETVGVTIDQGRLIVERQRRPHYTLDDLLEQCDFTAPFSDEDKAWLDAPARGGEL
jgi:antitoxin ChpS